MGRTEQVVRLLPSLDYSVFLSLSLAVSSGVGPDAPDGFFFSQEISSKERHEKGFYTSLPYGNGYMLKRFTKVFFRYRDIARDSKF